MAWTSPTTASAGAVLTAASWNAQVKGNMQALLPLDALAWSSYTPTLTQSGAVTKTVNYAKYIRFGNCVICSVKLTCTGAGTANNFVSISLPVTAVGQLSMTVGSGYISDNSANINAGGIAFLASTTTIAFVDSALAGLNSLGGTSASFAAALASPDVVSMFVAYEV